MTTSTRETTSKRVLVIGATGRTGRHIVDGLLQAGVGVRALARTPATADLPDAVDVVQGDLDDPASIARAADGTHAALLMWHRFTGEGAEDVVGALASHVGHIVYLSAADFTSGGPTQGAWADVEAAIEKAAIEKAAIEKAPFTHTFVRAGGFAANTLGWAGQIRTGNTVRIPFPQAGRSLVDERDLAAVAVRGLLDPNLVGASPVVTGPQTLTQHEQVHAIGAALGRELTVEEQSVDDARREYTEFMGADHADASLRYWATLVDRPEPPHDDVQKILGRPAHGFAEWAEFHADDFRQ